MPPQEALEGERYSVPIASRAKSPRERRPEPHASTSTGDNVLTALARGEAVLAMHWQTQTHTQWYTLSTACTTQCCYALVPHQSSICTTRKRARERERQRERAIEQERASERGGGQGVCV